METQRPDRLVFFALSQTQYNRPVMYSYTVRCTFQNRVVADKWLEWLADEHIADVLKAGAVSAEIFQLDGGSIYEIRYRFESRAHFDDYERNHAPDLRAAGLARFPLEMGLEYSRSHGQSLARFGMLKESD